METVYYEDSEVCVTNRRVIVHGKIVPLQAGRGVEQIIEEPAKIGWPVTSLCIGAVATVLSMRQDAPEIAFLWLVATLFCAVWMAARGTWYFIALGEPDQRELVVATKNEIFARDVVRAIRRALSDQDEAISSLKAGSGSR